jgi:hypothetical protein
MPARDLPQTRAMTSRPESTARSRSDVLPISPRFASRAAWNGVKPETLATVMGHSTTKILELYVHLFNREQTEDEFRQAMAR